MEEKKTQITTKETKVINVYKKQQYNQIKEMVKAGRFVSARLTAKSMGLDWHTVTDWMKTADMQKAAATSIDTYIRQIESAGKKDWKASDRLVYYATGANEEEKQSGGNVINVYNQGGNVGVKVEG